MCVFAPLCSSTLRFGCWGFCVSFLKDCFWLFTSCQTRYCYGFWHFICIFNFHSPALLNFSNFPVWWYMTDYIIYASIWWTQVPDKHCSCASAGSGLTFLHPYPCCSFPVSFGHHSVCHSYFCPLILYSVFPQPVYLPSAFVVHYTQLSLTLSPCSPHPMLLSLRLWWISSPASFLSSLGCLSDFNARERSVPP